MPVGAAHTAHLTPEQRETLQRLLRKREDVLRDEIGEDRLADLGSEPEAAALQRDVAELLAVEAALSRMHTPSFGLCADCRATIPYARFAAEPSAARCVACQAKQE